MKNKKIAAIIPTRMKSFRFFGKPLASIVGLPMIQHVWQRTVQAKDIHDVYVATCDEEIKQAVESFDGKVVMTSDTHQRCTDRVCEAAKSVDADIILNIQGDEPLLDPVMLERLIQPLLNGTKASCVNLLSPIVSRDDYSNPDIVKAVLNQKNEILILTRAAIPFSEHTQTHAELDLPVYRQTGFSAFLKSFLLEFSNMRPTPMENAESIDFMRILEHGHIIQGVLCPHSTIGVDRPEDIAKVEEVFERDPKQLTLSRIANLK